MTLDLKTTEARDIVRKLVGHDRHRDRELPPRHALDHVLGVLDAAAVPAGRIYTAADIAADPHYAALGEHTERVLASIGIDRAGYERLRDRGIV